MASPSSAASAARGFRAVRRNLVQARESGQGATVQLDPAYIPALDGLEEGQPVILLYWMDKAPRNIVVQNPRHTEGTRGTFALRSPARPNPIALAVVILQGIDREAGLLTIDAIDCHDDTPLLDIKPWKASIDVPPGWRPERLSAYIPAPWPRNRQKTPTTR